MPVTIVRDTDGLVAFYIAPGTTGQGTVRSQGKRDNYRTLASRRWELGPRTWEHTRRLGLWRPSDPYVVSAFWNEDGDEFLQWYVDIVEPLRRTAVGFDFRDLELDIVLDEDLSWHWKDQDEVDLGVELGVFTVAEAAEIRADGEHIAAAIETGDTWWTSWKDWTPDPSWSIPTLPDGWNVV